MKISYFKQLLSNNNFIMINDDLIIFNDFELYNQKTEESKEYNTLDDLLADNKDVKKIIEETEQFYLQLEGGRGSSSGNGLSGEMGVGFTSASQRGRKGEDYGQIKHNAELNYGTAGGNSVDAVLSRFQQKYGDSDREYGIAVDENGYVHQHIQGGKVSVPISGGEGLTIIHNHPSGGNFSKADLQVLASTKNKGIIATSSNPSKKSTYKIEKTNHFDAKGFTKALNGAKWPTEYSYDKGADWWLKKNAKTYGYKYTSSGVPKK